MSFINECYSIIRRKNKDMLYIYLRNNGLYYKYYDSNNNLVHNKKFLYDLKEKIYF